MLKKMSHLKELKLTVKKLKDVILPLTNTLHKGECGRIGVIGGSREYTGAPYFSAMTALRLGADLAHIFCTEDASTALKCYSPDLIVHPILKDENALYQLLDWEKRLHVIVIGPGLGRDPKVLDLVGTFIEFLNESGKPVIIDADGLHILSQKPQLLNNSKNLILTPNKVEFERLCTTISKEHGIENNENAIYKILQSGGITIVRKGEVDEIFDREKICTVRGGTPCRCGGQGDILTGAIALFTFWALESKHPHANIVGAYLGCRFTKQLNGMVYVEKGRSMVTGDFIPMIHSAYMELF